MRSLYEGLCWGKHTRTLVLILSLVLVCAAYYNISKLPKPNTTINLE